jgi:O-6-methylguanine DNA methyltransferase
VVAVRRLAYEVEGWGTGELVLDGARVVWHELPHPRDLKPARCRLELVERIRAHFRGEAVSFDDVELDLDGATEFHRRCTDALRAVPRGEVVTYGELAALAGAPRAGRAAGSFCARNRFGLIVPCHRVVPASGIGSYGSLGLDYKRRLLELDGVTL